MGVPPFLSVVVCIFGRLINYVHFSVTTKGILWDTHQQTSPSTSAFCWLLNIQNSVCHLSETKAATAQLIECLPGALLASETQNYKSIIYDSGAFEGIEQKIVMSPSLSGSPLFSVPIFTKDSKAGEEIIRQGHVRQTLGC